MYRSWNYKRNIYGIDGNEYTIIGHKCDVCNSYRRPTAIYINQKLKDKTIKSDYIANCFWYITIQIIECDTNGIFASPNYQLIQIQTNQQFFLNECIETNVNTNKLNGM